MKRLTKEEIDSVEVVVRGNGRSNPVLNEVRELEIGEGLIIAREEWVPKSTPSVIIHGAIRENKKFSIMKLSDGTGWMVVRKENKLEK